MPDEPTLPPPVSRRRKSPALTHEPRWHKEPRPAKNGLFRAQLAFVGLGLLLLTGTLAWVSAWLQPPKPACVVLIGAGYQENLAVPPNVYGWRGLSDLSHRVQSADAALLWGEDSLQLQHEPLELRTDTPWDKGLDDFDEKTVIVYMAAHGGADSQGAYLLPNDATASPEAANRLRVAAVLQRLARLPKEKNKILVLDAAGVTANWRMGMLSNEFARQLRELEPRIEAIPNLIVMASSDVDQRSCVCPELRRTIYTHFVLEGLRGGADDRDHDGRVSAWELQVFLRKNVQRWVEANRGALQTPILLPSGDEGVRRASRIDLVVASRSYQPPDPHQTPVFVPPAQLREVWQEWTALAASTPSPAANTPVLWRRYQDTLLRYEQLLRAEDTSAAARMRNQLRGLQYQIQRGQKVHLASLQNTLAMPWAAGMSDYRSTDSTDALNRLWNAAPAERGKLFAGLLASRDPQAQRLLRLETSDLLLQRMTEDPLNNLRLSCDLLRLIDDPLRPKPAEVQFALMLQRDLPKAAFTSEGAELIKLALTTRRLAERAALSAQRGKYADSQRLHPWVAQVVQEADAQRRPGEDLLFADQENWPRAEQRLHAAARGYRRSLEIAEQVQEALRVRNQALAMLPYYTHWMARRRARDDGNQSNEDPLLDEMESMWRDTHELARRLQQPGPRPALAARADSDEGSRIAALAELAQKVWRAFQTTQRRCDRLVQELANSQSSSAWRDADDALVIPCGDANLRMKLLENKRRIARRVLIDTAGHAGEAPRVTPRQQRARAVDNARRQGRLALAALGSDWFNACPGASLEDYQQTRRRLDLFSVEENGWKSLLRAGEQIGYRWERMAARINSLVANGAKADSSQADIDLDAAGLLARQIDGASGQNLLKLPTPAHRDLRLQELLVWQARRAWEDHWYGEDPDAEPYYRAAGMNYLSDAARLSPRQQAVDAMRARLNQPGNLVFQCPAQLLLTTEQQTQVDYKLAPATGADLPAGFPVTWLEAEPGLKLLRPSPDVRRPRHFSGAKNEGAGECSLTSPRLAQAERQPPNQPEVVKTALVFNALFRGQRLRVTTDVELHLRADVTVDRFPAPAKASVAVQASTETHRRFGDGHGAVTIVLDASGSMGPAQGQPFSAATKYSEATQALREVLQRLPRGTMVSLWVFGQALGAQKSAPDAERTIRRVQAPVRWNPSDPGRLQSLMSQVEYPAIEPWNESPIVEAMLSAKQDLLDAAGFKTLLVITDGMDNRFAKAEASAARAPGAAAAKTQDIAQALTEGFANTGIVVEIVGFKIVNTEEAQAQRQFQVIENFFPPGRLTRVSQAPALVAALDTALGQRLRYWVENYDNTLVAGTPRRGLEVGRGGAGEQWLPGGLAPGGYLVQTHTNRLLQKAIALNRGDLLLLRLVTANDGPQLQRAPYAAGEFSWKPHQEAADWRLTALQNQRVNQHGLQMLLALEKSPSPSATTLEQIRPHDTWIEITPSEKTAGPSAVGWSEVYGYPAPTYSVESPLWRAPAAGGVSAPVAQVWWSPDRRAPAASTLRRGREFKTLGELAGTTLRIASEDVTIESAAVETHVLETRPGRREPQPCLVVRLAHTPGSKLLVRPEGLTLGGCEHRFYPGIGRYTGLFWPVTRDEAGAALTDLGVISLDAFKLEAQRRGYTLKLDKLSPPQPTDMRPSPAFGFE